MRCRHLGSRHDTTRHERVSTCRTVVGLYRVHELTYMYLRDNSYKCLMEKKECLAGEVHSLEEEHS